MLFKNIKINSQFVILVSISEYILAWNCCECVLAGCMRINMSLEVKSRSQSYVAEKCGNE